jgi:hypothetical protein
MTVWIYIDTSKQVGAPDHLKVFADPEIARRWFERFDSEGVAFEYPVSRAERSASLFRSGPPVFHDVELTKHSRNPIVVAETRF